MPNMKILNVIPPDHSGGWFLALILSIVAIICLCMAIAMLADYEPIGVLVMVLGIGLGILAFFMPSWVYTPQQYQVTVNNMSQFDYQHWKIVDQEGSILTLERVGN